MVLEAMEHNPLDVLQYALGNRRAARREQTRRLCFRASLLALRGGTRALEPMLGAVTAGSTPTTRMLFADELKKSP